MRLYRPREHVPLPALSQPRLPRRFLRRPEKEAEAPLRNPITGIAACCAPAASGQAAAVVGSGVWAFWLDPDRSVLGEQVS